MTDVKLPILYDLVPRKGEHLPFFSPHTVKARLALAHKRVDFITEEVTYNDLRHTLAGKLGVAKATGKATHYSIEYDTQLLIVARLVVAAPILELPSGELVMDSYKIADYLEQAYPDQPSLFYPGTTGPVDAESPQAKMAKAYLTLFAAGTPLPLDLRLARGIPSSRVLTRPLELTQLNFSRRHGRLGLAVEPDLGVVGRRAGQPDGPHRRRRLGNA